MAGLAVLPVDHQPHRPTGGHGGRARQHAVVELTIRDLKDQALAHFPSAHFAANSAWTVMGVLTATYALDQRDQAGGETVRVARTTAADCSGYLAA